MYTDCFKRQGCECRLMKMESYTKEGRSTLWEIDNLGLDLTKIILSYIPMITNGTDATITACTGVNCYWPGGDAKKMSHPIVDIVGIVSRVIVAGRRTTTSIIERIDGKALTLQNIFQEFELVPTGRWCFVVGSEEELLVKLEVMTMKDFQDWDNVNFWKKYQIPTTESSPHWICDESSKRGIHSGREPYILTRKRKNVPAQHS